MSTWHRKKCNTTGPNLGIYYGSLILNVLIIYAFTRLLLVEIINFFIKKYNNLAPGTNPESRNQILGKLIRIIACEVGCLPLPFLAVIFSLIFVVQLVIALKVSNSGHLDGISHVWYLFCGILTAWFFEYIFKSTLYPVKIVKSLEEPLLINNLIRDRKIPFLLLFPFIDSEADWEASCGKSESWFESSYIWRFLPDALFVLNGLILSGGGILRDPIISSAFRWIFFQMTSTAFLLVSLLQRGESRFNFSRLLLETPLINALGKSSFFVYLLQSAFFNFYAKIIIDSMNWNSFSVSGQASSYVRDMWSFEWYKRFPFGWKITGFVCLVVISWLLQTYYQDYLVSMLANKLFSCAKANRSKTLNGDDRPYQLLS